MTEKAINRTETITGVLSGDPFADSEIIARAGAILHTGGLVAFPTETVYGLGGNGLDSTASKKIYAAKGRPSDNPLILHIADTSMLYMLAEDVTDTAELLIREFWPGPLTIVVKASSAVPKTVTGGLSTVAVRMPSHPAAAALIRAAGVPIAAPSANLSGKPSPTSAEHVKEDLSGRIDMIIDGGDVPIGLESTIVDVTGDVPVLLRPGYITVSMIKEVTGECLIDPAVFHKPEDGFVPKAPGMKYRHYAPKAALTIFKGAPEKVAAAIREQQRKALAAGRKVRILCAEENAAAYPQDSVRILGDEFSGEMIAHELYRALRECDEAGVDVILSEAFEDNPLSEAIMNRLMKAAGYSVSAV